MKKSSHVVVACQLPVIGASLTQEQRGMLKAMGTLPNAELGDGVMIGDAMECIARDLTALANGLEHTEDVPEGVHSMQALQAAYRIEMLRDMVVRLVK